MAVGALAVGGGAASALADSGDTAGTTTGTTTMTDTPTAVATTVTTPITVTTAVQGDDVADERGAADDVMAAANGVQDEAIAETDDDDTGDRHGVNDDSEESGDHGHHRGQGNGQSGSGHDDNGQSGSGHDGSDDDDSGSSTQSGDE
jgi:hypothetical protein